MVHKAKKNKAKPQHNMCWTPPYTRHMTKKNKTKTQQNMYWTPLYTKKKHK